MTNDSSPSSVQKKSGGELSEVKKEQIFRELRVMVEFYLNPDLDLNDIQDQTISDDIKTLQDINGIVSGDEKLSRIQKIISPLLKLFYKARKRATRDANRPDRYYDLMVDSYEHFKNIKTLLD